MVNINTVAVADLLKEVSVELQKTENIIAPEWADFVKTSVAREKPPEQDDWWHVRSASILRKIKMLGPIGTNKLRVKYGGKKRRGHKPSVFRKGSGNIIRKILQQLEKEQLIQHVTKNKAKGRVITPKGESLLAQCAKTVYMRQQNGKK